MNLKNNDILDPWSYFNIPKDDLKHVQQQYGWMMGAGKFPLIARNEMSLVGEILHPSASQTWRNPNTWDLHDNYAYKLALTAIIGSFLSQYYQSINKSFVIKQLPETVKKYFRYPYSETRDYNRESLKRWKATLPPAYQREVFING